MSFMKAFVRVSPDNMEVERTEVPVPVISSNEVLVQVKAFGVGVHDRYFIPQNINFPFPIGSEGAGIVVQTGNEVTDFKAGDYVILSGSFQPKGGCWAEYAAVSQQSLVHLPPEMTFVEGASIPVAGKTALECTRALELKEGDTLFIAGASGAIGTWIIQLAAVEGIRVSGSASRKNHEYMKSLGAEYAVDYSDPAWEEQFKEVLPGGVDAALAILPGTAEDCLNVVKDHGKIITVSGDRCESRNNITIRQFQHELSFKQAVSELADCVADGRVKINIEHIYPFEQAIEALEKTETRHARGKLVVSI